MRGDRAISCCGIAVMPCAASPLLAAAPARADETCRSPYMAKIAGIEDFVCVWTLGVGRLGDGSDKLATVDARESSSFGRPIHAAPVGARHGAHHGGFTDGRWPFDWRKAWAIRGRDRRRPAGPDRLAPKPRAGRRACPGVR